jgi:hypothetical protein
MQVLRIGKRITPVLIYKNTAGTKAISDNKFPLWLKQFLRDIRQPIIDFVEDKNTGWAVCHDVTDFISLWSRKLIPRVEVTKLNIWFDRCIGESKPEVKAEFARLYEFTNSRAQENRFPSLVRNTDKKPADRFVTLWQDILFNYEFDKTFSLIGHSLVFLLSNNEITFNNCDVWAEKMVNNLSIEHDGLKIKYEEAVAFLLLCLMTGIDFKKFKKQNALGIGCLGGHSVALIKSSDGMFIVDGTMRQFYPEIDFEENPGFPVVVACRYDFSSMLERGYVAYPDQFGIT